MDKTILALTILLLLSIVSPLLTSSTDNQLYYVDEESGTGFADSYKVTAWINSTHLVVEGVNRESIPAIESGSEFVKGLYLMVDVDNDLNAGV